MATSSAGSVMDANEHHEETFDRLFDEHARAILAYCKRRASAADADDALAEVFVVVWRRLHELPADGIRPWLLGVARRVLANQRRSSGRRERLAEVIRLDRARVQPPAEVAMDQVDERQDVTSALSRLREKDREVLTLIAWEGLSRSEAAQVVGCSPEAAKKRYQRALTSLRAVLLPEGSADSKPPRDPRSAPEGGD